jgi:hypothetical protein
VSYGRHLLREVSEQISLAVFAGELFGPRGAYWLYIVRICVIVTTGRHRTLEGGIVMAWLLSELIEVSVFYWPAMIMVPTDTGHAPPL